MHTPGKWYVVDQLNLVVDNRGLKQVGVLTSTSIPHEERMANCRLASAAPDLQKALELQGKAIEELMREFVSKKGAAADWGIINDAGVAAAKALAKSKGRI